MYVFPDYIRDSEVKQFFSAADLTVLPYRSATQSGISSVSCHFGVPMVVTDVGGLRETIGGRGTGIVCENAAPACIAAAIERFFDEPLLRERLGEGIRAEKERLSWSRFSEDLTATDVTDDRAVAPGVIALNCHASFENKSHPFRD